MIPCITNYLTIYYSNSNNILTQLIIVRTHFAQHYIIICISSKIVYGSHRCSIDTGSYNVTFIDTVLIPHFPAVAPICV